MIARAKDPWAGYQAHLFCDERAEGFPLRRWEFSVARLLFDRGYPVQTTRGILDFAAEFGTVECCGRVQDCDREAVEQLLPQSPHAGWIYYERWVWVSTEPIGEGEAA